MKKLFLVILAVLFAVTLNGQRFYLTPQARYHIPLTFQEAPEYFDAAILVSTSTGNYYTYIITENKQFSLARNWSFGGNAGYMFRDGIGFELGLYFQQGKQELASEDIAPHYPLGSTSWQIRSFNFKPAVVVEHSHRFLSLSGKAGFLTGLTSLGKSIFFDFKRKTYKFNTSLSYGYFMEVEIGFRFNKTISLTAAAGIENQFYKPRKALLSYDDFSYYEISDMPEFLKEIIYVREIDHRTVYYDSQSNTYYTHYYKPLMRLKESLKLNSFYAGFGLKYTFGNHEEN